MKKWHRSTLRILTVLALFTIAVAIVVTVEGVVAQSMSEGVGLWNDSIYSIVSLVVSFAALGFSMFTFHSIDKVNQVASADGNVLEDEKYSIAYYADISRFKDSHNEADYADKVVATIVGEEAVGENLVQLCDRIQRFIDNLIWIAYIDTEVKEESGENLRNAAISKLQKYLTMLRIRAEHFADLNSGIKYLLLESVSLIECVLGYLTYGNAALPESDASKHSIADVRGPMLRNPVSLVVFYDYLGLHYLSCAGGVLKTSFGDKSVSFYEGDGACRLLCHELSESDKELMRMYLARALENFELATSQAKDSLLWKSYIQYNACRARYLGLVCRIDEDAESASELMPLIEEMVSYRRDMLLLVKNDVLESCANKDDTRSANAEVPHSYIEECFDGEWDLACKLKCACDTLVQTLEAERE